MSRSFDDLVTSTEHAEPLHPVRALFRNHFYLDGFVSSDGGLWIAMINALLLIPLVLAAFFYPVPALFLGGALLLVSVIGYEGYVIWRRRHTGV
jgi:hypothetical protein